MPNVSVNLGQCCGIGCEVFDADERAEVMFTLLNGANAPFVTELGYRLSVPAATDSETRTESVGHAATGCRA